MTASATTGSDGLTVTMKAKAAVLCIVGVKKGEKLDINVKTAGDKYVSGLDAVKNSADFSVKISDEKVSLLSKQDAGVYYVVVPAGVKLSVYNGETLIKTTKDAGLTAGKYYTLTTDKTTGKTTAIINGVEVEKSWVQLWAGGPKFATENVAKKLNWSEATAEGSTYVWGAKWCTPTKDELNFVDVKEGDNSTKTLIPLNTKAEIKVQNGVYGLLYTGIQPGYTDKTLFLPLEDSNGYFHVGYWSSTSVKETLGSILECLGYGNSIYMYRFYDDAYTTANTKYLVRPILAE